MHPAMMVAVTGFAMVSGFAAVRIAGGKHRRAWLWGAVGLLLNVPGLLLTALIPVRRAQAADVRPLRPGRPGRSPRRIAV